MGSKRVLVLGIIGGVVAVVIAAVIAFAVMSAPRGTPEEQFLAAVHSQVAGTSVESDRDALALGVTICSTEEAGVSRSKMVEVFGANGFTAREANVMIDAAEKFLCVKGSGS